MADSENDQRNCLPKSKPKDLRRFLKLLHKALCSQEKSKVQLRPRRVPWRARREENLKVDKCVSGGQNLTKLALVFFILILIFFKKSL